MSDYVHDRLHSRIVEIVNTLIANGDIKNPKLSHFASISDMTISKDNAYATLYVTCLDEKTLQKSVKALQSASGYIQARLASVLKTKNTPKLSFSADMTMINAEHMDKLLESIKKDD